MRIFLKDQSVILSVFVFTLIINILMLGPTWYMLQIYDRVLTSRDENTLAGLSLIIIFVYIIYSSLEKYRGSLLLEIAQSIDENLAPKIRISILNSSISNRQANVNLFNDLNVVKNFLTGTQLTAILDAPWVVIYLIVIYVLNVDLGNIALLSALILLLMAAVNQKMTHLNQVEISKTNSSERYLISAALGASESVRAMSMQYSLGLKLQGIRDLYLEAMDKANSRGIQISSVTKFLRVFIQSAILGYGAYLSLNDKISGGMIIAGSILLGRILSPIESIINSWKQISEFKRSLINIQFAQLQGSVGSYSISLGRPQGAFELRNVDLILREGPRPALQHINLRVDAGQSLAIIGPSGAGKTSLLKTMAGILEPTKGYLIIDGMDSSNMNRVEFGRYVGYLGQSNDLIAGKVSENIARFGEIDSESVIKAAKKCGAHEMILSLPNGYETEIGDQGNGLSEGQKRKISLARALFQDPAILFLDEPDTSLDEASISHLSDLLKNLKADNVTVILTTHKSNIAMLADNVALLIEGEVKLFGPCEDVFKKINKS